VLVYASLLSNYKSKKQDQDFTFEEVLDWCENIGTAGEVRDITNAFIGINTGSAPREGGEDTQQAPHS
jgi:hypothetical protein